LWNALVLAKCVHSGTDRGGSEQGSQNPKACSGTGDQAGSGRKKYYVCWATDASESTSARSPFFIDVAGATPLCDIPLRRLYEAVDACVLATAPRLYARVIASRGAPPTTRSGVVLARNLTYPSGAGDLRLFAGCHQSVLRVMELVVTVDASTGRAVVTPESGVRLFIGSQDRTTGVAVDTAVADGVVTLVFARTATCPHGNVGTQPGTDLHLDPCDAKGLHLTMYIVLASDSESTRSVLKIITYGMREIEKLVRITDAYAVHSATADAECLRSLVKQLGPSCTRLGDRSQRGLRAVSARVRAAALAELERPADDDEQPPPIAPIVAPA
jgi:hypothetical protein